MTLRRRFLGSTGLNLEAAGAGKLLKIADSFIFFWTLLKLAEPSSLELGPGHQISPNFFPLGSARSPVTIHIAFVLPGQPHVLLRMFLPPLTFPIIWKIVLNFQLKLPIFCIFCFERSLGLALILNHLFTVILCLQHINVFCARQLAWDPLGLGHGEAAAAVLFVEQGSFEFC